MNRQYVRQPGVLLSRFQLKSNDGVEKRGGELRGNRH